MGATIGIFETFLCVHRRAPFWPAHWSRLNRSARRIGIPVDPNLDHQVRKKIHRLGPRFHRARLLVAADGQVDLAIHRYDEHGFNLDWPLSEKLICVQTPLDYPGAWAGHKTTSRLGLEMEFAAARRRGASDAILCGRGDVIHETTRGNIFWMKNGVVYTPDPAIGCLPGIMRQWVIRQLRRWRVTVREGRYTPRDLASADAVLRTNAVVGVRWVESIAGIKKWNHPAPPLVLKLYANLKTLVMNPSTW